MEKYVEDYYTEKIGLGDLVRLIEGELAGSGLLNESVLNEGKRFSYSIDIPKLVPTEAWGNPTAQDRAEINRVFSVIRGGANMKARIEDLNKFLDPKAAERRRSPSVILKMMMIFTWVAIYIIITPL